MLEIQPTPIEAGQLWVPNANLSLDNEYPVPTNDELRELWQDHAEPGTVIPTPGIYGAMRVPEAPPTAYVSLDICEVVRHTHVGIQHAQRSPEELLENPIKSIHDYAEGCTYFKNYTDIQSIAQVLIAAELIEPVDEIEQINTLVQRWRGMGAYVVANTSTLPGCEPGTISFFNRYMPGAFDALLLPRNHDSLKDQPTKGDVAAQLILATEQAAFGDKAPDTKLRRDVPVLHIDDKSCHNQAFRTAITDVGATSIHTLQPRYPSHLEMDELSIHTATPLAAFQLGDAILRHEMLLTTGS